MIGMSAGAARDAIFLGLALLATTRPAHALAIPDQLCGAAQTGGQDAFPSDAEMLRAADAAERRLRGVRGTGRLEGALSDLEVAPAGSSVPNPEALARYCTAAGEVMRLSVEGSQLQAQTFLLTAVRVARDAGADALTSQAAYRLGLVSLAGPPVGGARGGGSRLRRSGSQISAEYREAHSESDACASLARARLESSSNSVLSTLALDCAARQALQSGDPDLSARASLRLARLGLAWSESASDNPVALRRLALDTSIAAIPVALQVADPIVRAELDRGIDEASDQLGGVDHPAVRSGVAELQRQQHLGPAIASLASALQARLALAAGDTAQAQALIETAILYEAQRPLPMRLPEHYLLLAEADPAQRERHVFAAYTALQNMRPLLPRTDALTEESIFSLYMRRVFESAVEVQLAGTTRDDPARIQFAQEIVENFRQAELLSAVGSECIPPRDPVRPEDLAANEVLLYPLLLPDRVELLYVAGSEGGQARYRRLAPNRGVDRQQVSRLVEDLVFSMSYGGDEAWREPARRLYDILIKPIEDRLAPDSMLVIVPDGPLRALPFAALVGEDGRFLVQRTRLSIAPALAYSTPGDARSDNDLSIVAASLQREVALPAGTFFALEGTAAEAQIAAGSGSPGQHIVDFRKDELVTALSGRPVDILHLATHASFNGRSDRAFIVANGEAIRLSELRDLISSNRRRGDALDLLILSACETAVGDDEASMGLAGAAVQAGALSAIASLWQVDDIGTAELMRQFYSRYRTGRSRSEALREAQLALLEGGGNNAQPNVWAAFTLLGAWR